MKRWGVIFGSVACCAVCGSVLLFFLPQRNSIQSPGSHDTNRIDIESSGQTSKHNAITQLQEGRSLSTGGTATEADNQIERTAMNEALVQEFAGSLDDQVERAVTAGLISVAEAQSYRRERQALLVAEEESQLFEMQEELFDEEN